MDFAGSAIGVVLLVAVAAGISRAPRGSDPLAGVRRLGRGARRWWILALAVALPLLVGVAAGLSSVSRTFAVLLVLAIVVPLLLACLWAWGRARSFS
jgi:heme A synthase